MTRAAIRARALEQAGEPEPLTGALLDALNGYIDEGYLALCADGLPETRQIEVSGGLAAIDELAVREVLSVFDALGGARAFALGGGYLRVTPDGTYAVRLLASPTPLAQDGDQPALPEEFHGALADYAAWRLLSTGGRAQQLRAQHYAQCFELAKSRFARRLDASRGPRRLRGRYA
ncbi:MAG: hypothetical protein GX558_06795 [Clostridiales bacterium]|nr:hypothetical protein [Clostridiales bacterium]